jgi:hypothetical protein
MRCKFLTTKGNDSSLFGTEDTQEVIMRFFSYTIGDDLLTLNPRGGDQGVVLFPNYDSSPAIIHNPIWEYRKSEVTTEITNFGSAAVPLTRSVFIVHLHIARRPNEIILKLALPMLFLAIMGAMSFWTGTEERISTTMTVLLAVSALYIVVFANIPMLGYLTRFDKFVIQIMLILFLVTAVHHIVIRFQRAEVLEKHPLRKLFMRLFDFTGRVLLTPILLIVYLLLFDVYAGGVLALLVVVGGFCAAVGLREIKSVRACFAEAANELYARSHDPVLLSATPLTVTEKLLLSVLQCTGYAFQPVLPTKPDAEELKELYPNKDEDVPVSQNFSRYPPSPKAGFINANVPGASKYASTGGAGQYTEVPRSPPTAPVRLVRQPLQAATTGSSTFVPSPSERRPPLSSLEEGGDSTLPPQSRPPLRSPQALGGAQLISLGVPRAAPGGPSPLRGRAPVLDTATTAVRPAAYRSERELSRREGTGPGLRVGNHSPVEDRAAAQFPVAPVVPAGSSGRADVPLWQAGAEGTPLPSTKRRK